MTVTPYQLLVLAKAPIPGRVKTRLCPPCTPAEAAHLAGAALADTLAVAFATPACCRVLVYDQPERAPLLGLEDLPVVAQRGAGLGERIAAAFADTALPGTATMLIGMDTPQVTPEALTGIAAALGRADAVLGPAADGGWWALALRDPWYAAALAEVPMSTPTTGTATRATLIRLGLTVATAATLTDVDTAPDARTVAAQCPTTRFARTWAAVEASHAERALRVAS